LQKELAESSQFSQEKFDQFKMENEITITDLKEKMNALELNNKQKEEVVQINSYISKF
jgi:hypothetical protein